MRHFALEGIKKAERTRERFGIPEDFSISVWIAGNLRCNVETSS
jgi:hypothetical protein